MKKILSILLVLSMLFALYGCSAMDKSESMQAESADRYYNGVYDSVDVETEIAESGKLNAPESTGVKNQKLIRNMTLDTETDDLDALLSLMDAKIAGLGGYIEDKTVRNSGSYRYANLTIRIPAERLDEFVDHISGASNVISHTEYTDDVTLTYVATQSRITALETEQTRLLDLMAKAENMSDLLLIQERLTKVRTELEEVTSRLRLYDNLVDYGTVNLSAREVKEYTVVEERTVWQRIGEGFVNSLKNLGTILTELLVFLIVALPYLLIPAAIAVLVILLRKRARKKKNPPVNKTENQSQ